MCFEEETTMTGPFFTVIIPAYNCEEFMRTGLDSIRDQDFRDYELIVVCDSCVDKTAEIAREYTDRVLEVRHGRAGSSRNDGLDIARGQWVLFMDDDDWYLPGAFRRIAERIGELKNIDLLAYGFEWKGRGAAIQSERRLYPAVWNKAWRRDFIGGERFPDWVHTDDYGFARRMHPRARVGYLPEVLYHYEFMRPGSVSDRISKGEYDNSQLPDEVRTAAVGYENWLKGLKR